MVTVRMYKKGLWAGLCVRGHQEKWLGLGQAKMSILLKLHSGLPQGWQRHSDILCFPSKAGSETEQPETAWIRIHEMLVSQSVAYTATAQCQPQASSCLLPEVQWHGMAQVGIILSLYLNVSCATWGNTCLWNFAFYELGKIHVKFSMGIKGEHIY